MLQQTLLYILTFVSGLFFGSFLNLVSDRILKKEKILFGRSKCDHCKKPLKAIHLIPLFSFAFQKGKCAMCGKKLSWYYPFSEILTGLLFIGSAYISGIFQTINFSYALSFAFLLIVSSAYVVIFLTDLKHQIIPNKVVYPAIAFVVFFMIANASVYLITTYNKLKVDPFGAYLLEAGYLHVQGLHILKSLGITLFSSALIAGFFFFLVKITKGRGMGAGDIKLGFLIGVFNGFPQNIIAIFSGFVIGAIVSLLLISFRIKTLKDTIPFGPFLIIGSIVALIWGYDLWNLYTTMF